MLSKYEKHIKILLICIYTAIGFYVATRWLPNIASWFMPLILAYITAWLTRPTANFLREKWRFPPKLAAVLSLFIYLLFIFAILGALISRLIVELSRLAANAPAMITAVQEFIGSSSNNFSPLQQRLSPELAQLLDQSAATISAQFLNVLGNVSSWLVLKITNIATAAPGFFFALLFYLITSFFVCLDFDKINDLFRKLIKPPGRKKIAEVRSHATNALLKYLRGMIIIMGINVVVLLIGLLILKVNYAFLLAFLLAFLDILPAIGTGIVLVPWGVITMILGDIPRGIGFIVVYIALTLARQLSEPKIMSKSLGLNPLVTVIAVYAGLKMFGAAGLIIMPILTLIVFSLFKSGILKINFDKKNDKKILIPSTKNSSFSTKPPNEDN